ncbi:MAG: hypothetical protein R6W91_00220 [Thermoplasmata archaeon]
MSGTYKCNMCDATFDVPAEGRRMPWILTKAGLAIIAAITITFILFRLLVWTVSSPAMKPAVYLYAPGVQNEQLKLKVRGIITTRIPHRDGITSIAWDNLTLKEGKIFTDGDSFDYLFYETESIQPRHENAGWVLARQKGNLTWNGAPIDRDGLLLKFKYILSRYGLFENEIKDFIEYWFDEDMKIFFQKQDFIYGIIPVSIEELDRIFAIETNLEYREYIRIQFLMKELQEKQTLAEPKFPEVSRSEYALHEWGIIKG